MHPTAVLDAAVCHWDTGRGGICQLCHTCVIKPLRGRVQDAAAHIHKNWECHCSHCTVDFIFTKASTHYWKANKYISTHPWHLPTKQDFCSDPLGILYSLFFIFSGITWQKLNQSAFIYLLTKFTEIQFGQLRESIKKLATGCFSLFHFMFCKHCVIPWKALKSAK